MKVQIAKDIKACIGKFNQLLCAAKAEGLDVEIGQEAAGKELKVRVFETKEY